MAINSSATQKMVQIMRLLKVQMNGAVTQAMDDGGVRYGLNYGVALHTVRGAARPFGPDRELAELLWRQDVRELQLAALVVADPLSMGARDVVRWAERVTTVELAQCAAPVFAAAFTATSVSETSPGFSFESDFCSSSSPNSALDIILSWIDDQDAVRATLGCYTLGRVVQVADTNAHDTANTDIDAITAHNAVAELFADRGVVCVQVLAAVLQHVEGGAIFALRSIWQNSTDPQIRAAIAQISNSELQSQLAYC